jgi:hypothetical protein
MTPKLYLACVLILALGQALQILWIKIPDLKTRAKLANQQFIFKDWWSSDWNLVLGTFVCGAIAILGLDELIRWKPEVLDYVKWFFAALGFGGSNLVLAKLSKYTKYFNQIIDEKTNIADGISNTVKTKS